MDVPSARVAPIHHRVRGDLPQLPGKMRHDAAKTHREASSGPVVEHEKDFFLVESSLDWAWQDYAKAPGAAGV